MKFNPSYLLCFLVLLSAEIFIATFIKSGFLRHTLGDFLVVIMLYCLIKSFFSIKPLAAAWIVLLFATFIEIGQYFDLLNKLELGQNSIAKLVLGTTFSIADLLAYLLGVMTVVVIEKTRRSNN